MYLLKNVTLLLQFKIHHRLNHYYLTIADQKVSKNVLSVSDLIIVCVRPSPQDLIS